MSGHGHVIPNKRAGNVKRCGGPSVCGECAAELANLSSDDKKALELIAAYGHSAVARRLATLLLAEKHWK